MKTQKVHTLSSQIEKRTCFLLIHSKETLKSYVSSSQIGEGAYFSLIFCRKTENFHSLLKSITKLFSFLFSQRKSIHLRSMESTSVFKQNSLT